MIQHSYQEHQHKSVIKVKNKIRDALRDELNRAELCSTLRALRTYGGGERGGPVFHLINIMQQTIFICNTIHKLAYGFITLRTTLLDHQAAVSIKLLVSIKSVFFPPINVANKI